MPWLSEAGTWPQFYCLLIKCVQQILQKKRPKNVSRCFPIQVFKRGFEGSPSLHFSVATRRRKKTWENAVITSEHPAATKNKLILPDKLRFDLSSMIIDFKQILPNARVAVLFQKEQIVTSRMSFANKGAIMDTTTIPIMCNIVTLWMASF